MQGIVSNTGTPPLAIFVHPRIQQRRNIDTCPYRATIQRNGAPRRADLRESESSSEICGRIMIVNDEGENIPKKFRKEHVDGCARVLRRIEAVLHGVDDILDLLDRSREKGDLGAQP